MAPPEGPPVLPVADAKAITQAAAAMQAGGIVGIPTETVYGLGVAPRPEALQALAVASQRPDEPGPASFWTASARSTAWWRCQPQRSAWRRATGPAP
jgi:tRNA A37 threonylcarbamoyladenosine synthetase subunit TsaC/SUA5/YrdC